MPSKKLSETQIRSALQQAKSRAFTTEAKNVLLGDGLGLYLAITPKATASWLYRYSVDGQAKAVGLGAWPTVGLKAARDAADKVRSERAAGIDPVRSKQQLIASKKRASSTQSFADCAETYIEHVKGKWRNEKHQSQWRNTLSQYAYPKIGKLKINEVTKEDVLEILLPIWKSKHETASRLRGRIEQICDWAIANDLRVHDNPARFKGLLEHRLPAVTRPIEDKHHASMPYKLLPEFMKKLQAQPGMASWALELLILCGNRTKEITHAEWTEFSLTEKVWVIPGARMKAGVEHRIPLTDAAMSLLERIKPFAGKKYVFITGKRDTPMSNMAMAMLLRRMGQQDITVHGFRSTFRMWAAEQTTYPFEICEQALSHGLPRDGVARAYARTDFFVARVGLMNDWARYARSAIVNNNPANTL
jgi:integrase